MGNALYPCEIVEPQGKADACVIWLHGLGANGHDFVPVVPHLRLPDTLNVRFVFPHAPDIPVTCNGNYIMPAWYDILALTEVREINIDHLKQARAIQIVHDDAGDVTAEPLRSLIGAEKIRRGDRHRIHIALRDVDGDARSGGRCNSGYRRQEDDQ